MSDFDKDFEDAIEEAGGVDAYLRQHGMDPEKLEKESKVLAEVCMSNRLKGMLITELLDSLEWMLNAYHGIGRSGDPPSDGEWKDILAAADIAVDRGRKIR